MADRAITKRALLVAADYPVFPTNNKKPVWSNEELGLEKGQGGYKIASQDPAVIRRMFNDDRAKEIAVPMGEMSGLLCVDVDVYKDIDGLLGWMKDNEHILKPTRMHKTRSGGLHFIFKHPGPGYKFPSTLREGVDLKANGTGYICWPGTRGYKLDHDLPIQTISTTILMEMHEGDGELAIGDGATAPNSATDEALVSSIIAATDLYPALRTLSMRLVNKVDQDGAVMSEELILRTLSNLMGQSDASNEGHTRHEDWADRLSKLPDLVTSALAKREITLIDDEMADLLAAEKPVMDERPFEAVAMIRRVGPQKETTLSDIEVMVAALQEPEEKDDGEFKVFNAQGLMSVTLDPIEWIIPQLIPKGAIVSLAGTSNVGKTRWLSALAMALAVGDTKRMGLPQCGERVRILWLANEERADDIARRLKAAGLQHKDTKSEDIVVRGKDDGMIRLVAVNEVGNAEIDAENVAKIIAEIRKRNIKLVIFDPYVTLSDVADENSAASAAILTKAFILISMATGATVMHAHHTPKDRSKDADWYRGDSGGWRGSGAIYSGLDVGITLANWLPTGPARKAWKDKTLDNNLARWIVLDTGKIREGKPIAPIVYELVGQPMALGEGDDIGVCRLADADQAANCLLDEAVDTIAAQMIGEYLVELVGRGKHTTMSKVHNVMAGVTGWPNTTRWREAQSDWLVELFGEEGVMCGGHAVLVQREKNVNKGGPVLTIT